jgi:ATP-dependent Lon protease
MTGEITLRGRVLPIGGLRDKILAAQRSGVGTVIIPEENRKDLAEITPKEREDVDVRPMARMDDVLRLALVPQSNKELLPERSEILDWRLVGAGEPRPASH